MLTFDPGKQWGGGNLGSGGLPPVGVWGGSTPSGGIKGGQRKDHILVLKNALKINFSVFSRAVRSLLAPTVSLAHWDISAALGGLSMKATFSR